MKRDGVVGQDGDRVIGVAGVGGGEGGGFNEDRGVGEDVWAGQASDTKNLGGQGVAYGGVCERGVGRQGSGEGREVAAVRAAVAVEAGDVGVGGDAGEGDGAVVGAVCLVGEHKPGDVRGEGGRSGGEGVVDVGGEAAL